MNAYSKDLRMKMVEAKESGMSTIEFAHAFGVGRSSVKRYAKTAPEGGSLRPKSSPGRRPKADESARILLEADLEERSAATLAQRCEYLRNAAGLRVSESTVSRLLRHLGWTRKRDCEYCDHGARDVPLRRSDPKTRGLCVFPPIRRPIGRASQHRRSGRA